MAYHILDPNLPNPIKDDQCIGDTLTTFNANFLALDTGLYQLSAAVGAIPADNDSDLYTLINTLSTNMQNIGNYPYLEYGWVCAPNAAGQSVNANTLTTLTIDTEIADTNNYGSITNNQITLASGTYQYLAEIPYAGGYSNGTDTILSLYNITNTRFVTRKRIPATYGDAAGVTNANFTLQGQFTITASTTFDLRVESSTAGIAGTGAQSSMFFSDSTAGYDQRTTIKLWKVG